MIVDWNILHMGVMAVGGLGVAFCGIALWLFTADAANMD